MFAYFKDFTDDVGFDWVEEEMSALTAPSEDIWRFVYPTTLTAQRCDDIHDHTQESRYVVVEGNCGWEKEHGIMLSWREGTELAKVSAFDGHATNGHAFADPASDAFIYCAVDPATSTRNPVVSGLPKT